MVEKDKVTDEYYTDTTRKSKDRTDDPSTD